MDSAWWKDEPNTRGTYGLISSCIFTLGLCVWTAIHLNIPEQAAGGRQFMRKIVWLSVGLLAPEVITFTAWYQFADAMRLLRARPTEHQQKRSRWRFGLNFGGKEPHYDAVEGAESENSSAHQASRRADDAWNIVHGFYVVMGGYAVDFTNSDEPFLPKGTPRLTLTTDGVQFLLEHAPGLFPRVSEEDIRDKSKADGLAKLLVVLQAAWFCLQCIARGAQHLPISLLEITTGGHALYTLFTYVLWAHKPMNINAPTVIFGGEELRELCAYMFMCSRISRPAGTKREEFGKITPGSVAGQDRNQQPKADGSITLTPKAPVLQDTGFRLRYYGIDPLELDANAVRRWRLAWRAIVAHPGMQPMGREYLVLRASNVPVFKSAEQATGRLILAFTVAEVMYAGIHAFGWNAVFASAKLQAAWRVATCIIGGGGLFIGVFGFSWAFADGGKPYWDQTWVAVLCVGAVEFSIRMFLLIEALLNVAVLPAGAYQLPQWSTYIPHWA